MKRNVFVSSAAAVVLVAGGPVAAASTAGDAARAPTAVTAYPPTYRPRRPPARR
ncbi:hypothetical protein [Streptomyces sp. PvR034]|uniref:hypothetical protein n=1 Tax=Streptomyces sp. PvR034 TaxID=3156401 RepID=UPI00339A041C